jgi:small subunit ribosomal protein S2
MEKRKRLMKRLISSQVHVGISIEKGQNQLRPYRNHKRHGNAVRNREHTVEELGRVFRRIGKTREKGEKILFVGTSLKVARRREQEFQQDLPKKRKESHSILVVNKKWVSGLLTNHPTFQEYVKTYNAKPDELKTEKEKKWYRRHRKDREEWLSSTKIKRPGRVVFRNPVDHPIGVHEAYRCGIPTVGLRNTECKFVNERTYLLPANESEPMSQVVMGRRLKESLKKTYENRSREDEENAEEI